MQQIATLASLWLAAGPQQGKNNYLKSKTDDKKPTNARV